MKSKWKNTSVADYFNEMITTIGIDQKAVPFTKENFYFNFIKTWQALQLQTGLVWKLESVFLLNISLAKYAKQKLPSHGKIKYERFTAFHQIHQALMKIGKDKISCEQP